MISAGDFRNGTTFEMDGGVYVIVEFQHVKPGKGAAFVRAKIKNVITGSVIERTFNPNEKFETAFIERKDMQYLYNDDDLYYFMDLASYEQIPISKGVLSENFRFVKENMVCRVLSYKGNVFGVEPPLFVELEVTQTDPGFKGDTATNVTKPAILETGAEIRIPLFIDQGEKIKIDTRTGMDSPLLMGLWIVQTDLVSKRNIATNVTKSAILETGIEICIPLFID